MVMNQVYTLSDRELLIRTSRESIKAHLNNSSYKIEQHDPKLDESRGVFVTLHIGGELRGCIGYPLPVSPLIEAVAENAVSAAFRDPRFGPLREEEFELLDIEISVLTVPAKVDSADQVVLGRDGIIVSKGPMRGLLLPQVPVEQKWDLETYLKWGCMKAGLPGDEWKRDVEIMTFQAEVFGEGDHNE